jgi:small neutral amino acid transporter SnatA (MarC family)
MSPKEKNEERWAWLFVAPTMIGLIVLNFYPIFQTIYQSFCKTGDFGKGNIFIGLAINMAWVFLVIKSTGKIQQLLGDGGMMFSRKFFGIILLAMSVKLFAGGIAGVFTGVVAQ